MTSSPENRLTPERWRRIEELFQGALDRDEAVRGAFLDAGCGDEAALRDEVESLLAAHRQAGSFMGRRPAEWLGQPADGGDSSPWTGRRIGPYTVAREIGRGGMGRVLLAERDDREYRGRVAIKVVDAPLAARGLIDRFRQERQILADLDHPNIARLLDAGTLPEGLPYLVMEHVDGLRIDEYCDRERLPVEERIRLFREICDAVHHAHRRLVVHRDLKPDNVLVTPEGRPKLLDFGIAKLLQASPDGELSHTVHLPMTARYASPEQVRGRAMGTATDVYSLGVLLYELLAGKPPYEIEGATLPEVIRRVAEEQPRRPSTVVDDAVAHARRASGRQLRRRLEGDLDNVVLAALRKDPDRRYSSVLQLSDDLRRHLEEVPVSARPDTLAYRAGKFWRRNRIATSLGALLVASFLVFAAVVTIQGRQAARERDKAEQALAFLVSVFRQTDPIEASAAPPSGQITASQFLDLGARRVERELADQPELQATLLNAIGGAYLSLGAPEQAGALFEVALDASRGPGGQRSELAAASLHGLAQVATATAEYETAETLAREALEIRREVLGPAHPETVETATALAGALLGQERPEEAETLLVHALETVRRRSGDDASQVADVLERLADLHWSARRHRETEALLREVLAIRRRVLGDDHPLVAKARQDLGVVLHEAGELEEAAELYRQARQIWLPLLDEDHPHLLMSLNSLGMVAKDQGRYRAGAEMLRRLLERRRAIHGAHHPTSLTAANNLATLEADRGNWAQAARLWEETLETAKTAFGEGSWYVAGSLVNLGFVVYESGDLERAEDLERQALEAIRQLQGEDHPLVGRPLLTLGRIALERGDVDAAEAHTREALELWRRVLPPGHSWTSEAERELGAVHLARGRYAEAERLLLSGYLDDDGEPALHGSRRLRVLRRLVELYDAWGRPAEALRHARAVAAVEDHLRAQSGLVGSSAPSP